MKTLKSFKVIFIGAFIVLTLICNAQTDTIDYFGQTPPNDVPKIFSVYPSGSYPTTHSSPSFSPSGDEAFWSTWPDLNNYIQTIYYRKKENGKWSNPSVASFSGGKYSDKLPCFSGDGKRVYFTSDRPFSGNGTTIDENIWYIEKTVSGWSSPICLDSSVNSSQDDAWISIAANNNLYFGRNGKLYCAKWTQDHFLKAQELPVNFSGIDNQGCIALDESYIIIQSIYVETSPNVWADDLYIIFQVDGIWSKPIKLDSKINSMNSKSFVQITPDGKYLFFLGNGIPYWVNTDFVEPLRKTVSTNEINNLDNNTLEIFPNPTKGLFTISFGTTPIHEAIVNVFNLQGRQIFSKALYNTNSGTFDLTGYPAGIYFIRSLKDNILFETKIIKE